MPEFFGGDGGIDGFAVACASLRLRTRWVLGLSLSAIEKAPKAGAFSMAETVGFEPTIESPLYTLSRRAPSTTRPRLRIPFRKARP
jgi:hypothetical protein